MPAAASGGLNITMTVIWSVVIVAAVILELTTTNLTSVWFACGGVVALIFNLLHLPVWLQLVVFLAVSASLLFSVGRIARKKLKSKVQKTNVEAAIGTALTVIRETTPDAPALVKFNGIYWSTIAENGQPLKKGEVVIVQNIDGNKFIVKKGN